jgi:hypothetical protein
VSIIWSFLIDRDVQLIGTMEVTLASAGRCSASSILLHLRAHFHVVRYLEFGYRFVCEAFELIHSEVDW